MASGRWYIAFPSGPFRFSTRIACNRYFRRLGPCMRARVCREGASTYAYGHTRPVYTFTCIRSVYTCIMYVRVSVADMFLRRDSEAITLEAWLDTRGPLYSRLDFDVGILFYYKMFGVTFAKRRARLIQKNLHNPYMPHLFAMLMCTADRFFF